MGNEVVTSDGLRRPVWACDTMSRLPPSYTSACLMAWGGPSGLATSQVSAYSATPRVV